MNPEVIPIFQKLRDGKADLFPRREYDLIQAFRFQGADKILAPAIHHRAERRQTFYGYPDGFEDRIEPLVKQSVPVVDQVFLAEQEAVPHVTHIPGDLRRPVAVGIMGDAAEPDFPAADVHEK